MKIEYLVLALLFFLMIRKKDTSSDNKSDILSEKKEKIDTILSETEKQIQIFITQNKPKVKDVYNKFKEEEKKNSLTSIINQNPISTVRNELIEIKQTIDNNVTNISQEIKQNTEKIFNENNKPIDSISRIEVVETKLENPRIHTTVNLDTQKILNTRIRAEKNILPINKEINKLGDRINRLRK